MMVHGLQALAFSIPFSYIHAEILVYVGKVVDNRHYKFAFLLVKTNFVNNMNLQCRPQLAEYERCHYWRYRRAMLYF